MLNNKALSVLAAFLFGLTHQGSPFVAGSCVDDTTYTFFSYKDGSPLSRQCVWLTARPDKEAFRVEKFCKTSSNGFKVEDKCISSCNNCPSTPSPVAPTPEPTKAPVTPDPTKAPVNSDCEDSSSYIFYSYKNGFQIERKCVWLTALPNKTKYRVGKFCNTSANGSNVKDECTNSCNNCPSTSFPSAVPTIKPTCKDSTTFTFDTLNNGLMIPRKCTYLTSKKASFRIEKFCKGDVLTECANSCDNC